MDLNNINKQKYLKYKNKYLNFKKINNISKYIKNHKIWSSFYNQEGGVVNTNDK